MLLHSQCVHDSSNILIALLKLDFNHATRPLQNMLQKYFKIFLQNTVKVLQFTSKIGRVQRCHRIKTMSSSILLEGQIQASLEAYYRSKIKLPQRSVIGPKLGFLRLVGGLIFYLEQVENDATKGIIYSNVPSKKYSKFDQREL